MGKRSVYFRYEQMALAAKDKSDIKDDSRTERSCVNQAFVF